MNQLIQWLNQQLEHRKLNNAHVHGPPLAREDGDWYYVPVYLDMRDAYDKAVLLQQIESDWEQQAVQPGRNLLLIPAAN